VGSCFHCIASAPGETTPRPRDEALHKSKPNEVIHFDYLCIGPSVDDAKYVLIVKDDYSNFVCSNNARTRMLTVQQPYSFNDSLPLVWLSNRFPTKAVISRTPSWRIYRCNPAPIIISLRRTVRGQIVQSKLSVSKPEWLLGLCYHKSIWDIKNGSVHTLLSSMYLRIPYSLKGQAKHRLQPSLATQEINLPL
jgi:hypothetical protein